MKTSEGVRFGIGTKLILGLGTLIGISVLVGALASISMFSIEGNSGDLSQQYLPVTQMAADVERQTLKSLVEVRGYWLSQDSKYYDDAVKRLEALEKALSDLETLVAKSPKLAALQTTLPKVVGAKVSFAENLARTKVAVDTILRVRVDMDKAAEEYFQSATSYFESENASLRSELRSAKLPALLERQDKVEAGRQILEWGHQIQVANYKTQALRDESYIRAALENFNNIEQRIAGLLRITRQQINKDELTKVLKAAESYQDSIRSWVTQDGLLEDLRVQRLAAVDALTGPVEEASRQGVKNSLDLATANSLIVAASNWTILIGLIVSLVLGVLVASVLTRSITGPLRLVTRLSQKVTRGDFAIDRVELKSQDELSLLTESFYDMVDGLKSKAALIEKIANGVLTNDIPLSSQDDGLGRSLQRMQDGLNQILTQVNVAVEQMASGSDQVSTAAQSLSQGATEQASSLEEISASVNEIHSQSKQNAENAITANQLAKQASKSAQQGNQQMLDLMALLNKMTKSSEQTKSIVKTIDDIAFQVNLLALNANVEAARAGKYGKGFAVVAEEVRNLAVRSATAVKETTRMVEESIRNIQDVNATASKTGDQLIGILGNANKVADFLEEIAASSQEQARAMGQINGGLDQIDQVTQSNTANAEESASASEELSGQGQQLKVMISRFQLSDRALYEAQLRAQTLPVHRRESPSAPSLLKKASAPRSASTRDIILNDDFDTF